MTDGSLAYARVLRREGEKAAQIGMPVTVVLNAPSAIYLASVIERGCQRSDYVRTVQAEAERLRDAAEEMMLAATEANTAAEKALADATKAGKAVLSLSSRARALWWGGVVFWWAGLPFMAGVFK